MYLAFLGINYSNLISVFEGQIGEIVDCEHEFYIWSKLEIHLGCESLSSIWADWNHWQVVWHVSSKWVALFSVWADQNRWRDWLNMHSVCESLSSVWADQNHWQETWTCTQAVSPSLVSEQIRIMAEHASGKWVCSPVFNQIRTTNNNGWTHIQWVSPSLVFEQIRTSDDNG